MIPIIPVLWSRLQYPAVQTLFDPLMRFGRARNRGQSGNEANSFPHLFGIPTPEIPCETKSFLLYPVSDG